MSELLVCVSAVSIFGIIAIGFAQPPPPRELPIWNDELERSLIRRHLHDRW